MAVVSWLRRGLLRTVIWLLTGLIVLHASLTWIVPLLVRKGVESWLLTHKDAVVKIQKIHFNPWVGSLAFRGVDIYLPHHPQHPVLNLRSLEIQPSFMALLHRKIIIKSITLFEPHLWLIADAKGEWNVNELLQSSATPPPRQNPEENAAAPGWLIRSFQVYELHLHILDTRHDLSKPLLLVLHRSRLENIGTIGRHVGQIHLHLHGDLPGEKPWRLIWDGSLALKPLQSAGHIQLSQVNFRDLRTPVRQVYPLDIRHGVLQSLSFDYSARMAAGQLQGSVHNLALQVQGVDVYGVVNGVDNKRSPRLILRQLRVEQLAAELSQHTLAIKSVSLDAPELLTHRNQQGQIDVVQLLQKLIPPPDPTSPSWQVALQELQMNDGKVHFNDLADPQDKELFFQNMQLRLQHLDTGSASLWPLQFVARGPLLGTLRIRGKVNKTAGDLDWQAEGLHIPNFNPLLPKAAGIDVQSGFLDAHGVFRGQWQQLSTMQTTASVVMRQVQAHLAAAGGVQLAWQLARLQGDWRDRQGLRLAGQWQNLQAQQAQIQWTQPTLSFNGMTLDARLRQLQLATLTEEQGQASGPWGSLQVADAGLYALKTPLDASLVQVDTLQVQGVQSRILQSGKTLGASLQKLALQQIHWNSQSQRLRVADIQSQGTAVSLQKQPHPVQWKCQSVDLSGLSWNENSQQGEWTVAQLQGLTWTGAKPWLDLERLQIPAGQLDLLQHRLQTGAVQLHVRSTRLAVTPDNQLKMVQELGLPGHATPQASAPSSAAWGIHVDGLHAVVDRLQIHDRVLERAPIVVQQLVLDNQAIDSRQSTPSTLHLAFQLQPSGAIDWQGQWMLNPLRVQGNLSVQALDMLWLQPYLEQTSRLHMQHGNFSAQGAVDYSATAAHYQGSMVLNDTSFEDQAQQPVLSWASVAVPDLRVQVPGHTHIAQVVINNLFSRVEIEQDKTLNWLNLLTPATATAQVATAATPSVPSAPSSTPTNSVAIDQIQVHQAGIDFTDQSLPTPFHVSIHGVEGAFEQLDQRQPTHWSPFTLQGIINHYGQVAVQGQIQPFVSPLPLEVGLHFKNIEMPTLNPYSMVFAGYQIDQGMLDLKLQYQLHNNRIDGKNHFRVDQLELGPHVANADGETLPLKLAVDVLRNREGVINLDIPVYGNLDDPSFDIRRVIMTAIEQSIKHVVESPLSLVADLLGEDSETLRYIEFVPGSSTLNATSLTRLKKISTVLLDHQALIVSVKAYYDMHTDTQALQQLSGAANVTLSPGSLRDLAIRRAEAVKKTLLDSGIVDDRIFIDEPGIAPAAGPSTWVRTTIDIRHH